MNLVLQTSQRLLLSVDTDELNGLCNALNEVCHGVDLDDVEFETRLGASRAFLSNLLHKITAGAQHAAQQSNERVSAWADKASVQALCITACGDPVDMSVDEAKSFSHQLRIAIRQAEDESS